MRISSDASAIVIGAGGLGCPAAIALAAAGARRIAVVDDDRVDPSNLHRQILHAEESVGQPKGASFAAGLRRLFPTVEVTIHAVRFEASNAAALIAPHDVVLDGSDNFATKFLANDAAVLGGKALVHGAAVGLGGQLVTVPAGGRPCYRCLFEEQPPPGVGPSCAESGVLGPVPGVIGALAGVEAARILRGETPAFVGRLVQYDSRSMLVRSVRYNPNPACAVCGPEARIRVLSPAHYRSDECVTP